MGENETKKKGLIGGLTMRILVIGLVLQFLMIGTVMFPQGQAWGGQNWGDSRYPAIPLASSGILILFIIVAVLGILKKANVVKKGLTSQELVILFAWMSATILIMMAGFPTDRSWEMSLIMFTQNDGLIANYGPHWPAMFDAFPSKAAVQSLMDGGAPVPWGEMSTFVGLSIVTGLLLTTFTHSIIIIMRKRWIEEEKLAFPFAQIPSDAVYINEAYPESKNLTRVKMLAIGAVIGFLWMLPSQTQALTGVDVFSGWFACWGQTRITCVFSELTYDYASKYWAFTVGTNMATQLGFTPTWFMLALLVPLDVLQTTNIVHLAIYVILIPILTVGGALPVLDTGATSTYEVYHAFGWGNPFSWTGQTPTGLYRNFLPAIIFDVGGMLGIAIVSLILSREYIIRTLQSITGKAPAELEEENEALPYRYAWIILIVSGIAILALFAVAWEAPIGIALTGVILLGLIFIASIRMRAEAGYGGFLFWSWTGWGIANEFFGHPLPGPETSDITPAYFSAANIQRMIGWGAGGGVNYTHGYGNMIIDAYKVGSDYKTSNRDIFIAVLIGTIIPIILYYPIQLTYVAAQGGSNVGWTPVGGWHGNFLFDPRWWWYAPQRLPGDGSMSPLVNVAVGIIIVGGLMIARTRFIWFPLNPVGVILANSTLMTGDTSYLPFGPILWAYIAKLLIYRLIGGKFFTEKVQPLSVGFLVGYIFIASLAPLKNLWFL
jgi:hypothetical protein